MKAENPIKLKICGMRDHGNIARVASVGPDMMGFIFYEKSPRFVGEEFQMPHDLLDNIQRVGVFVQEDVNKVIELVRTHNLDFVQLHGGEPADQVEKLKGNGIKVIKVFSLDEAFDFDTTSSFEGLCDFFLFDTKGKYHGGNARVFDWKILHQYNQKVPFLLSGGLNLENISEVWGLSDMNLYGVDLNSGVEIGPGLKDEEKVRRIKDYLQRQYT